MSRLRPYTHRVSSVEEIMQITLLPGQWIQVALSVGTPTEPRYEIVQLAVYEDGRPELRGNLPIERWHHEATRVDGEE